MLMTRQSARSISRARAPVAVWLIKALTLLSHNDKLSTFTALTRVQPLGCTFNKFMHGLRSRCQQLATVIEGGHEAVSFNRTRGQTPEQGQASEPDFQEI